MTRKKYAERDGPSSSEGDAVIELRKRLGFSQALMGKALNCSAMEVSRMERGGKLSASLCVQLGNLAGDPGCWYFWERAGLRTTDVLRIVPHVQRRLRRSSLLSVSLQLVHAGKQARIARESDLVAVSLSPLVVASHGGEGSADMNWTELLPTSMFATPRTWCPNPNQTTSFRVQGESMAPTIPDGCIIVVDTGQNDHSKLMNQIVVVHSQRQGLVVSRMRDIDNVRILVSEDGEEEHHVVFDSEWTVIGKVLWWIVQDETDKHRMRITEKRAKSTGRSQPS